MKNNNQYDISKSILDTIRKNSVVKESEDKKGDDAIAITNDAKFGQNVLQNQIDSFKQTVHPGARFSDENNEDPKSNPLVYFKNTKNLVFSGSIPNMSNLKFQYSLNDVTDAPYIFVDGLALTDDVIDTLKKMNGHYKNWKDEFLMEGDLLDKL